MHGVQVQLVMGEHRTELGMLIQVKQDRWTRQPDDCDAFDSDVDEAPMAQTMFMANLSSTDPVYDEAGSSYDSNILSEVHDHDHYQDVVYEHHEEHKMHDDVQPTYVVYLHANYTNDSNMIPYDHYVKDNAVPVQQVKLYERWARFELTEREQKIDEQLRIVITDRNIKEENLKKELHSVKMQLASTINHNKSMVEEVTSLKKDFKQKENKYLKEFLDMKALKEKVEDKLYKEDQKYVEIEWKNLLIANDNLIVDCLSKEVFYIATNSELTVSRFTEMHEAHTIVQTRCLELEAELSKLQDKTHSEADRTLDFRTLDFQITQLTEKVSVLQEQNELFRAENEKVKQHYKELYAIDVEPIPPHNRNNREVHLHYLKHLKESVETLRKIVEEAKVERPLDRSLASASRYTKHSQELLEYAIGTCPKAFNQRDKKHAPTPASPSIHNIHNVTHKVKQVWKPKQVRQVWKPTSKVLTSVGHQWRPMGRIFTLGYGDYVIGDNVISRIYYVEGLGHNLFSIKQFCDSDLEVAFRKHLCYVRDTDGVE
ncbi:hypothetical protein Tco_1358645, partial [Tanacetum coccineum]